MAAKWCLMCHQAGASVKLTFLRLTCSSSPAVQRARRANSAVTALPGRAGQAHFGAAQGGCVNHSVPYRPAVSEVAVLLQ